MLIKRIMKTIKDIANEYAETRYSRKEHQSADAYSAARNGFIAGFNFAQQWVNGKEELPEEGSMILLKGFSGGVAVQVATLYILEELKRKNGRYTHWKQIILE